MRWAGYFTAAKGRASRRCAIRELAEHPLGLTWVVDDRGQRASHALVHDGRVWLVDPLDVPEAMERVAALGEPAGVLQLFVAHDRDGEAIAERLGVPFHSLPDVLPDAPFSVLSLDLLAWKERALWWPEHARARRCRVDRHRVLHGASGPGRPACTRSGVPLPPNSLTPLEPEHLLVGHGSPVHGSEAAAALLDALNRSRRDIPTFVLASAGPDPSHAEAQAEVACAHVHPRPRPRRRQPPDRRGRRARSRRHL